MGFAFFSRHANNPARNSAASGAVSDEELANMRGQLAAISKAQAVIEFDLDGRILTANDNFQRVMGYGLDEITGQHHSMFVDSAYRGSPEYRAFWERLGRGEYDAGGGNGL